MSCKLATYNFIYGQPFDEDRAWAGGCKQANNLPRYPLGQSRTYYQDCRYHSLEVCLLLVPGSWAAWVFVRLNWYKCLLWIYLCRLYF